MRCADFFWLRSAGFAADALLQDAPLSTTPEFVALMAQLQRRESLHQLFSAHIASIGEEQCRKVTRKLKANHPISVSDLPLSLRDTLTDAVAELQSIAADVTAREEALRPEFAITGEQMRQQLIDFLAQPDVAEAIFISNPEAAQRIDALIAERYAPYDSRKKQKIRLGWSYAQRFCTKNDTCSFFGPIAWGRFSDSQDSVSIVHPPGSWLSQRKTFFESWVMQRIVTRINSECPLPKRLPLMLNAGCYLHHDVLYYPLEKTRRLTGRTLAVLQKLNESGAVINEEQLSQKLNFDSHPLIQHLIDAGIVQRGFQLSPRDPEALEQLRHKMVAFHLPVDFVARWSDCFHRLMASREAYSRGDITQRQQALLTINQTLNQAGISLARESGKMYIGRYPLYEDCARASRVIFSRELQQHINNDFAPLMYLYRWLTRATAFLLHQEWLSVFQGCLQKVSSGDSVSLLLFLQALQPQQSSIQQQVYQRVLTMLEKAWQPLFTSSQQEELVLEPHQIEQVMTTLEQQCPAVVDFEVLGDSFHSPDFMLAAASLDALNQGEYQLVIGETHPAVHTLSQPVAAPFSPYLAEIEQEVARLFGRERVMLADSPESYQRSHIDWPLIDHYSQLILPSGGGCVTPDKRYAVGRARVRCEKNRLTVLDIAGVFQEDLLCVNGTPLHQLLFHLAGDIIPRSEPRRIRFNRTIYKRRSWTFGSESWPVALPDEFDTFIQWQSWRQSHDLPLRVFIKCDSEPKPLFVDFDNPLSLDALMTALKKAKVSLVSEMLPAPEALWFNDARGRVCCEVRSTFSSLKQEVPQNAE